MPEDDNKGSNLVSLLESLAMLAVVFLLVRWMITTRSGFITLCVIIVLCVIANMTEHSNEIAAAHSTSQSSASCRSFSSNAGTMSACIE